MHCQPPRLLAFVTCTYPGTHPHPLALATALAVHEHWLTAPAPPDVKVPVGHAADRFTAPPSQ